MDETEQAWLIKEDGRFAAEMIVELEFRARADFDEMADIRDRYIRECVDDGEFDDDDVERHLQWAALYQLRANDTYAAARFLRWTFATGFPDDWPYDRWEEVSLR